jgi:DNA-binding transcriptional LysR family regulator
VPAKSSPDLSEAEDAARGLDSLRGLIRLALPVIYGTREVIPRLAEFLATHPQLRVEMTVSDERQDLVAEGADVAIRLGTLEDSVFGARKLGTLERLLVGSPAYLQARGKPKIPADLTSHDCIIGPRAFSRASWTFRKGDTVISVDVTGRIRTESGPAVFTSVMSGLGITIMSSAMCAAEVRTKQLVPLLRNYKLDPVDVHAVFPGGPRPSAKVRAFVDFLAARLKDADDKLDNERLRSRDRPG